MIFYPPPRSVTAIKQRELYPANTGHSNNAVSMLGQRRRRWANIETILGECHVFAWYCFSHFIIPLFVCPSILGSVVL